MWHSSVVSLKSTHDELLKVMWYKAFALLWFCLQLCWPADFDQFTSLWVLVWLFWLSEGDKRCSCVIIQWGCWYFALSLVMGFCGHLEKQEAPGENVWDIIHPQLIVLWAFLHHHLPSSSVERATPGQVIWQASAIPAVRGGEQC